MQKYIVTIALLFSTLCHAQVQFGIKGGVNVSNFTGGDFEDVEKKAIVAWHAGAYLTFNLGSLAIQPEVLISTQGAKIDSANGSSYDWKLTYVNVPVMVLYRFTGGLYIEAGPQFGFKIDEKIENETINEFINGVDIALALGAGFKNKKGFGLGARYAAGVSKVGDFETSSGIDPDFKNGVLQFSVYFPLFQ